MNAAPPLDLKASLTAALDWWREAGVDCDFLDDPQDWLAKPEAEAANTPPPPAFPSAKPAPKPEAKPEIRFGGEAASWPADLASFPSWWMSEPSLDNGHSQARVPPRGAAQPALMVIVPQPETGDAEAGKLLCGPQGKLLAAMLPALGLTEGEIYIAAALPRAMPAPDWAALKAAGAGEVLAHHIALVAPQRVLAFGGSILPLLGNISPQNPALLPIVNQEGASVSATMTPALEAHDLGLMLDRPKSKRVFWQNWLKWTG